MKTPEYTVKVSPKAKHLRLKLTIDDGLSVIVPRGFDQGKIPDILEAKKEWIANAMERAEENRKFFEPKPKAFLPERLALTAIGETWSIHYDTTERPLALRQKPDAFSLFFTADVFDRDSVVERIRNWLRARCKEQLTPLVNELAEKHSLSVNSVMIRNQRTRWGSCSAKKNISLNMKLLFVSPELVRYVMIHELCHVREMNHTNRFWRLVESIEPNYRTLDSRLRDAWKVVPQWMY